MKIIIALLLIIISFSANAQVKFSLEHVKNKDAAVVYTGTVNTFSVSHAKEITVKNISASAGNLQMIDDHTFVLYVQEVQHAPIELSYTTVKNGVKTNESYPVKYIVKQLPDYFRLRLGDYFKSGKATLAKIKKNHQIRFNDADFNGDLKSTFITFDFILQPATGMPFELKNVCSNKSADMKTFHHKILSLRTGDTLLFRNIKAVMDSGTSRDMDDLTLEVL